MVKIYTKIIRRKYKRGHYDYPKHLVPVSASFNKLMVGFLKKSLDEHVYLDGETLHLTPTKQKGEVPKNADK